MSAGCPVCVAGSLSTYGACDRCREQLEGNSYRKRMRLFEEVAEQFHQRHFGRAYIPFAGWSK